MSRVETGESEYTDVLGKHSVIWLKNLKTEEVGRDALKNFQDMADGVNEKIIDYDDMLKHESKTSSQAQLLMTILGIRHYPGMHTVWAIYQDFPLMSSSPAMQGLCQGYTSQGTPVAQKSSSRERNP